MTDDEHSTTGILKRRAPFWGWLRSNPSLVIGGLGILISGAVTWNDLKTRMDSIELKMDELTKKPSPVTEEQFTLLKNDFVQLHSEVDRQKGRWEQVDSVPELRSHRVRKP